MTTPAEYLSPEGLDAAKLRVDLQSVLDSAHASRLSEHVPSGGAYWKALDLVHLALRLNGMNVWDVRSPTQGSSLTTSPSLAREYLRVHGRFTVDTIREYLGARDGGLPSTKIVVGLSDRLHGHTRWATHPNNEGQRELITDSMRISDMDDSSQALIRDVFGLSDDFDLELIQGQTAKHDHATMRHIAGLARGVIGD